MSEKKYTEAEFKKAVDAGISAVVGRREAQFDKTIKDLGFENVDEIKALKVDRDKIKGEFETLVKTNQEAETKQSYLKAGIDEKFINFVATDIGENKIEEYVKNNPQYLAENFSKTGSNPKYEGGKPDNMDAMRINMGLKPKGE